MQAQAVHDYFTQLQTRIVAALEALEGASFGTDRWQRAEGGGGVTRVIEDGRVFERSGGIFFDDFADRDFDFAFSLSRSVADHFLDAYRPILERRKNLAFGEREREFQAYRRGRYVEFNLVYDRGTLFGLQSGGRAESILISLPPRVAWRYDWKPEPGAPEEKLYTDFVRRRDWV